MPEPSTAAQQVAQIVAAAEETAERIRREAEERLRDRIAEADRAARNRVQAAEQEAADIVRWAREEADRARETSRSEAQQLLEEATGDARDFVARAQAEADRTHMEAAEALSHATSEAKQIVARAHETSEATIREANEAAAKTRSDADERSRELLREARTITGEVKYDGTELIGNLQEMSDSLRTNADRLLRDIKTLHSSMVRQIDRVDAGRDDLLASAPPARARSGERERAGHSPAPQSPSREPFDQSSLDVPEFIPPR